MKVTPSGWVVDKAMTQPNYRGIFNCSTRNIVRINPNVG
jgi:hypothetical protein